VTVDVPAVRTTGETDGLLLGLLLREVKAQGKPVLFAYQGQFFAIGYTGHVRFPMRVRVIK
jgi:hypothetical protein